MKTITSSVGVRKLMESCGCETCKVLGVGSCVQGPKTFGADRPDDKMLLWVIGGQPVLETNADPVVGDEAREFADLHFPGWDV